METQLPLRSMICPHLSISTWLPLARLRMVKSSRSQMMCSLQAVMRRNPLLACKFSMLFSMLRLVKCRLLAMKNPNFFLRKQCLSFSFSTISKMSMVCATVATQTSDFSGSMAQWLTYTCSSIHSQLSCHAFWFSKSTVEVQFTNTQGVLLLRVATTITFSYLQGMRLWAAANAIAPSSSLWQEKSELIQERLCVMSSSRISPLRFSEIMLDPHFFRKRGVSRQRSSSLRRGASLRKARVTVVNWTGWEGYFCAQSMALVRLSVQMLAQMSMRQPISRYLLCTASNWCSSTQCITGQSVRIRSTSLNSTSLKICPNPRLYSTAKSRSKVPTVTKESCSVLDEVWLMMISWACRWQMAVRPLLMPQVLADWLFLLVKFSQISLLSI